jgi:hypothetical protein
MNWIVSDDDQGKAIEEIEQTKSDRATGIVAAAFVERDLQNAIEARLCPDPNLVAKLFKPGGPVGDFGTKADLGFLLRIYDSDVHADLGNLVWIRNRFAHHRKPLQFDSRDIRKRIDEFRLIKRDKYPQIPGKGLPEENRTIPKVLGTANPRDKFIATVKLLAITLWAASHDLVIGPDGKPRRWVDGTR